MHTQSQACITDDFIDQHIFSASEPAKSKACLVGEQSAIGNHDAPRIVDLADSKRSSYLIRNEKLWTWMAPDWDGSL